MTNRIDTVRETALHIRHAPVKALLEVLDLRIELLILREHLIDLIHIMQELADRLIGRLQPLTRIFRELAHLPCDDGEPASHLARTCCLDGGVERE